MIPAALGVIAPILLRAGIKIATRRFAQYTQRQVYQELMRHGMKPDKARTISQGIYEVTHATSNYALKRGQRKLLWYTRRHNKRKLHRRY